MGFVNGAEDGEVVSGRLKFSTILSLTERIRCAIMINEQES